MHLLRISLLVCTLFSNIQFCSAQYSEEYLEKHPCFIGSSLFTLYNIVPDKNPPEFVQFNFGYRINPKNTISVELIHWKYAWPLGIPYGKHFEAPSEKFPGFIREKGFALAYQHYWWKGLYTGIHVLNGFQNFYNENNQKIDKGFHLFNTYRLGYHFKLFKNQRFFIEPSIAITHSAYQSKMPDGFENLNNKWNNYLIGEPGLHFGYNF